MQVRGDGRERLVETLKFLGAKLRAQVPVGRGELGVTKKVAHEHGAVCSGDQAAGGVAEPMQADGRRLAAAQPRL